MQDYESEIYKQNIGLVYSVVNSFKYSFLKIGAIHDIEDLVQVGGMGLVTAIRTYNEAEQTKFSTYATACIINAIKKELTRNTSQKVYNKDIKFISFQYIVSNEESDADMSLVIGEDDVRFSSIENRMLINQIIEIAKNTLKENEFNLWYQNIILGENASVLCKTLDIPRTTMAMRLTRYRDRVIIASKINLNLTTYDLIC